MADLSPEQYLAFENAAQNDEAANNEVSRRTFLRGLAGTAIGVSGIVGSIYAVLRADTKFGDQIYGGGDPEIGMVDDAEAERKFPRHFNVVGGGFGVYNIESLAAHVHEGLGNFGQTAYIKNSNSGLNPELQKRKVLGFLEDRGAEVVNLYGHSMDGMLMTEIGSFLLKNGVKVQVDLKDCSPEQKYDVRPDERAGAEVLAAFDRYGEFFEAYGGPGTRFMMESAARILDGRVDFEQIAKEALDKLAPDNVSNRLLASQAHYMCAFDGSEWGPDYPSDTVIGKLRPEDWNADPTINNRTALVGWRANAFPQAVVHDVAIKGGGHANPGAEGARYTETLMRFGREMNLYQPSTNYIRSGGHHIP